MFSLLYTRNDLNKVNGGLQHCQSFQIEGKDVGQLFVNGSI